MTHTTELKPINTSIYDFPTLIGRGFVYVDKTAQIYEIAKPTADGIYFFPRPRRFGKSLLISTLKALFQGRRELFRGLAIEKTDWDWETETYPVLHCSSTSMMRPSRGCSTATSCARRFPPCARRSTTSTSSRSRIAATCAS